MKKKIKYFIKPIGKGLYLATWLDGKMLNEMLFTDRNEVLRYDRMKNPYKHNKLPFVVIDFKD